MDVVLLSELGCCGEFEISQNFHGKEQSPILEKCLTVFVYKWHIFVHTACVYVH